MLKFKLKMYVLECRGVPREFENVITFVLSNIFKLFNYTALQLKFVLIILNFKREMLENFLEMTILFV